MPPEAFAVGIIIVCLAWVVFPLIAWNEMRKRRDDDE